MAGLRRSSVSFRRQGSSGLIRDDKYLSRELINQPVKHKEETNKKREGKPREEMTLQGKASSTIGSTGRSQSNRVGRVSRMIESPSPKASACGLCSAVNGKKGKSLTFLYVNEFGAKGDGITDDTKIFQDVWKMACSSFLRPKMIIPRGYSFLVRPIDFVGPCRSKVSLLIEGSIVAPKDPKMWDGLDTHKWLCFVKVRHLTVEGGGTINGMGQEWWATSCKINTTNPCRHAPTAMSFRRCNNLRVRDIRMLNSQQMHIAISNCKYVEVSHMIVQAPAKSPNTDGIHITSSTFVVIKDCTIRTGDDCISIVSNSSSIMLKNIACGPGHGIREVEDL